ncbi:transcription/translation regulatory transformer protein RfaH [Vibrio genomosp. F10]|uniref:Transcription antitermination protein RfaH n=2 Tax=Vibrio genomosp. F10 TaxID=723171 RepID=A0A1B9QZ38_9VIBR|nr:transcription/translation regulatory transformer protein RfaH [Vibrio genomosp. F10]OCH76019.1 transcriptional activator RfaH [Vibrio genomosp. F10]OEE34236.1 transcriptional activator RfaH [Vibrio genomosp. F10 str. ZF-129]OEE94194.1 transcriptional activator RfaH [Vibrio genomosp. F10 str. 9ZC157]OEF05466.1 transcriptional activator RfaH [Vibrio genomosp. F10 str. 9ZD137]OEF09256.1 transcriptional activator RfaH [Vibrio genomosp. F10 str. 9ZB36]
MKRWYLLYCKRGEQQRAKLHLENQNVEVFYPEVEVEKITRGKKAVKKEPLFPSYMFVRFDFEAGPSLTTVRSTRGVVDFVRMGNHPQEVQGDLIYTLKQLEQDNCEVQSLNLPEKGDIIGVVGGQFAGIDAIYQESDGEARSILLVKMISKKVPISIANKDLDLQ